jgi:hypothetical protein
MVGYLFVPYPKINGTKMHWIYIDNLKGNIPGKLVQTIANLMHVKTYLDMKYVMKKYQDGDLNLNDSRELEYNIGIENYHKK